MKQIKAIFALFIIFSLIPLCSFGQELMLTIKVKDSFSSETLLYAHLELLEADSVTTVYNGKWGWHREWLSTSAVELGFRASVPKREVYVARVSAKNYETRYVRIEIPRKSISEYIAKDISLDRADSFYETTLGEATVQASRIAMVVKGDTIEYDARAFRLAEGSMLDKLLAMLPGMKLDEYGEITLNGEHVNRLLVNGRNFFNGDVQAALRNLPAYVVSRVQAYHQAPEWEYLLSEEERKARRNPLVVDVKLKREYTKGWLANFEAGDGTRTRNAWDNVYLARLFAMNYNDHTDLTVYANTNNVGYDKSPTQRGRWQKPDVTEGNKRTSTAGINYNLQVPKNNLDLSSSFKVDNERADLESSTNLVRYINQSTSAYSQRMAQTSRRTQLNYEGRLSAALPKTYIEIRPEIKYVHNNNRSNLTGFETYAADLQSAANDTVRQTLSENTGRGNELTARLNVSAKVRGPWSNKNYSIDAGAEYEHKTNDDMQNMLTRYPRTSEVRLTPYADNTPLTSYMYNAGLTRQLLNLKLKKASFFIDARYSFYQRFSSDSRLRRDALEQIYSDEATLLPSARVEELLVHNLQDSYHTTQLDRTHKIGTTFSFQANPVYVSLDLVYNRQHRSYFDLRACTAVNNTPVYNFFDYNLKFKFKHGYELSINSMTSAPLVFQILNSSNNSDPTTTYIGNPDLKPTNQYRFQLEKSKYTRRSDYSFIAAYTLSRNSVGDEAIYDPQTAHWTYQYRNINGNRFFALFANYGQTLDKKERFRINLAANFRNSHSVDFSRVALEARSQRSVVNNNVAGFKTELSYNNQSIICKLKADVTYQGYRSRPYSEGRNGSSFDHNYGFVFIAPIVKNLDIDTDIMLACRSGYKYAGFNGTDLLWNASLAYSMGRRKQFVLRATAVDLLRQASSVKRFVNLQGYSENRYSTSPSYVLLSLLYRFDVKPKNR